jgi:hypothetical protein
MSKQPIFLRTPIRLIGVRQLPASADLDDPTTGHHTGHEHRPDPGRGRRPRLRDPRAPPLSYHTSASVRQHQPGKDPFKTSIVEVTWDLAAARGCPRGTSAISREQRIAANIILGHMGGVVASISLRSRSGSAPTLISYGRRPEAGRRTRGCPSITMRLRPQINVPAP